MTPKCTNEVAQVVETCCVTRIRDAHARFEQSASTCETYLNQVPVGRHPYELPKHAGKEERAHCHQRRELRERVLVRRIRINPLPRRVNSFRIPIQLIRAIQMAVTCGRFCRRLDEFAG